MWEEGCGVCTMPMLSTGGTPKHHMCVPHRVCVPHHDAASHDVMCAVCDMAAVLHEPKEGVSQE